MAENAIKLTKEAVSSREVIKKDPVIKDYSKSNNKKSNYKKTPYFFLKRLFDITLSTSLAIVLSPLIIITSILIKAFSKGPIFFKQERVGLDQKKFTIYKFRSMHVDCDDKIHKEFTEKWINSNKESVQNDGKDEVHKIVNDPRIIPVVGNFIRKLSVDELPQLINVIKGDMSLVGPRPPIEYEVENYEEWYKERFNVLPGISGLWQVSGRNRLTFEEMIELDVKYVKEASIGMDIKIAAKTPFIIFDGF